MFSLTCAGTTVQSRSEQVDHIFILETSSAYSSVYQHMDHGAGFGHDTVLSRSRNSFIGLFIANSHYSHKCIKTVPFFRDCNDL